MKDDNDCGLMQPRQIAVELARLRRENERLRNALGWVFALRDSFPDSEKFATSFDVMRVLHEAGKPLSQDEIIRAIKQNSEDARKRRESNAIALHPYIPDDGAA